MNRILLSLLAFLGIGTVAFIVTACYGPLPENYKDIDIEEYLDSIAEDMDSINNTTQSSL